MFKEINRKETSPSFRSVRFPKLQISILRKVLHKFTKYSIEPPCWNTSALHQHGGQKIVQISDTHSGYLGDWLSELNNQTFT